MHIHSVVEECEIVELLQQIDPKTKKPMKKKVLFVKNGAVVLCRVQVRFPLLCVLSFSGAIFCSCKCNALICIVNLILGFVYCQKEIKSH